MEASMISYHKKCDEFSVCCEVGNKGVIFLEKAEERKHQERTKHMKQERKTERGNERKRGRNKIEGNE